MLVEIVPILTLLIAALLILSGGRLTRRIGVSEAIGRGVALCILAIVLGLSPGTWRAMWAGGDRGDHLLVYARLVGLTGLLFVAGTSFRLTRIRKGELFSFGIFGIFLFASITLSLAFFSNQPTGTAMLVAAVVVSSSLWFTTQLRTPELEHSTIGWANYSGAITLTAIAMLGLYFADVFKAIPTVRRSVSAYLIVTIYELVKLAVLFAFAYFVSSRFLARAAGQVSPNRGDIGFILISILFFALISLAAGQLGAMAWAFFAGALWRKTARGIDFSKSSRPLASALLLSFVFISLPLQSHGRQFSSFLPLLIIVLAAVAVKMCFAWFMFKRDSVGKERALTSAAAIALPGEIAILFLGFSVARWFVDAPVFFVILVYAFASSLLIPLLRQGAIGKETIPVQARELMKRGLKAVV